MLKTHSALRIMLATIGLSLTLRGTATELLLWYFTFHPGWSILDLLALIKNMIKLKIVPPSKEGDMTKIQNETQYKVVMDRIEELLAVVTNDTPRDDPKFIELELLSNLSADYSDIHYSVKNLTIENGKVVEKKKGNITYNAPKFRIFGKRKCKVMGNYVVVPKRAFSKKLMALEKSLAK